ncbi:MAG: efflux RND transporter periplasmic adaptor subunit, partial [Hyphomicrobiales bacterium]|nr:efflux RND transporter periplasmic adaptor subunit [Hyphomicrobiales bacterium]
MLNFHQASLSHQFWRRTTCTLLTVTIVCLSSASIAEEDIKISAAQVQTLGIRSVHPVSSRNDLTLPYPAQIVIPTPQLWVVSSPVAGMVTSLSVARGDRVDVDRPLVTLESPSFVSLQREYLQAFSQDVLAAQQLKRNAELFDGKAVPQRVLETSQAEARQASIAVAEKRQMLRLSGLADAAIARLTTETAITATMSVAARQQATVVE